MMLKCHASCTACRVPFASSVVCLPEGPTILHFWFRAKGSASIAPHTEHAPDVLVPVSGDRGLRIKNPLGDCLVGQNNDFYKGLDIKYHALEYANDPPKRGLYDARACA